MTSFKINTGTGLITIRQAREEEASALAVIGLRAWEDATRTIETNDDMRENAHAAFAHFTAHAWRSVTIADAGGVLAGWGAREGGDDMITDFWIDPLCQRRGIGARLLSEIERQIIAAGFSCAHLESHTGNEKALSFFAKNGYSVSWLSMKYARRLDREVQTIGLRKQLTSVDPDTYGPGF